MRRSLSHRLALAGCVLLIALLPACAHLDGQTVDAVRLNDAIERDDVGPVRAAIESRALGVNQSIPVPGYQEGTPLLTIAARSASLTVLRYLISAGADVNARTPVNETALMLAAYFFREDRQRNAISRGQHDEAARLLVAAGAEIENDPYHYTPLSYAAYQGHEAAVRFLIERGARVDADAEAGTTYINTPLMMAAIQGHYGTALQLLRAGANAAIRVRGGHTAAEFAEKYRHAALARLLHCAESVAPGEAFQQKCDAAMAQDSASPRTSLAR
jgi:ankyrin repeat protein